MESPKEQNGPNPETLRTSTRCIRPLGHQAGKYGPFAAMRWHSIKARYAALWPSRDDDDDDDGDGDDDWAVIL